MPCRRSSKNLSLRAFTELKDLELFGESMASEPGAVQFAPFHADVKQSCTFTAGRADRASRTLLAVSILGATVADG
jgi:hypothetical protein